MTQPAVAQQFSEPRIRPAVVGDVAFCSATWKQSFWRESPWAKRVRWGVFAPHHSQIIQRLLERSSVLVACDPEREEEILGYIAFELPPKILHWSYVKPSFRRAGVFSALLAATGLPGDLAGCAVTHCTRAWFSAGAFVDKETGAEIRSGKPGLEDRFPLATHDPYLAFMEHP